MNVWKGKRYPNGRREMSRKKIKRRVEITAVRAIPLKPESAKLSVSQLRSWVVFHNQSLEAATNMQH